MTVFSGEEGERGRLEGGGSGVSVEGIVELGRLMDCSEEVCAVVLRGRKVWQSRGFNRLHSALRSNLSRGNEYDQ